MIRARALQPQAMASLLVEVRTNPKLRAGLWAIVGILWFYGVLVLHEEVERRRQAYQETVKELRRVEAMAGQAEWPERREAARALVLQMEGRLWSEGTLGLAQASLLDWLNRAAQRHQLLHLTVNVGAQEDTEAAGRSDAAPRAGSTLSLWKVTAKMSFDFDPKTLYPFLAGLQSNDKALLVESLTIRAAPAPRVDMAVVAYHQRPQPVASSQGQAPKPES